MNVYYFLMMVESMSYNEDSCYTLVLEEEIEEISGWKMEERAGLGPRAIVSGLCSC